MNNKIIISFFLLITMSGTALAADFQINKGWNLVSTETLYDISNEINSPQERGNFLERVFHYHLFKKTFHNNGEIYSDEEYIDKLRIYYGNEAFYLSHVPVWYYSDKDLLISNDVFIENTDDLEEELRAGNVHYKLSEGWNFISIELLMLGKYLDDFKGDCNVEKMYAFDSGKQEWTNLDFLINGEDAFDGGNNNLGIGLAIKASNNCEFDLLNNGNSISPPTIPN